jgi:hypothetical protein
MVNEICWKLNTWGFSFLAALLRLVLAVVLPTEEKFYGENGETAAGYKGWIQSPLGVLAFRNEEGALQWRW